MGGEDDGDQGEEVMMMTEAATETKVPQVGDPVSAVDANGVRHAALITAWWGGTDPHGSCNVVFVSGDPAKSDPYGRQVDRMTSVPHRSKQSAPGYYWE